MVTEGLDLAIRAGPGPLIPSKNFSSNGKFKGLGDPNGVIIADIGATYLDTSTGEEWQKKTNNNQKIGWVAEASSSSAIIATGSITARSNADRWAESINVKDFGAAVDGSTDDTAAIRLAVAALTDGKTLIIPGTSLVRTTGTSAVATITGLKNITVKGKITVDSNDLSTASTSWWYTVTSITAVLGVCTVTTAAPHGLSSGTSILIHVTAPDEMKGAVTVTVVNSTQFTYTAVQGAGFALSSNSGSGDMKWSYPDYERTILRFVACTNVTVDEFEFIGPYRDIAYLQRLGYVALDFRYSGTTDNQFARIRAKVYGAVAGVSVNYFRAPRLGGLINADIDLDATNTGYPIQSWGGLDNSRIKARADGVHRGSYFGALRNSTVQIGVKNFAVSGCLITTHFDGSSIHYGAENLDIIVNDIGTTDASSYGKFYGRYLFGFSRETGSVVPTTRNIKVKLGLVQTDALARNMVAFLMTDAGIDTVYDGITLSGFIDRSAITSIVGLGYSSETNIDMTIGSVKNFLLTDWRVENSAETVGSSSYARGINIVNLTGPFVYRNATVSGVKSVTITGSAVVANVNPLDLDDTLTITRLAAGVTLASATRVLAGDGTASLPSLSFTTDPDTGWLNLGATGVIRATIDGTLAFDFTASSFAPHVDATVDLGVSEVAARWRDLFISRNSTNGGTLHSVSTITTEGNLVLTGRAILFPGVSAIGQVELRSSNNTDPASLVVAQRLEVKTGDFSITVLDSGKTFTNTGATAIIIGTLPAASVVSNSAPQFTFFVDDTDGIRVKAVGDDVIVWGGSVTSAAGSISSTTRGAWVTVTALNSTTWFAQVSLVASFADP